MARKRKEEKSLGRPSEGVSEARLELRLPFALAQAMQAAADEENISVSEAWRQAAKKYLGGAE